MRAVSPAKIGIVYRTVKNYAMDSRDERHKKRTSLIEVGIVKIKIC